MLSVQDLQKQEETYRFSVFNHQCAFDLAIEILQCYEPRAAGQELKEGLGIRIRLGDLVVFQYLMDNKNEDEWLRKKERVVWGTGVSSMLAAAMHRESGAYEEFSDYSQYCLGPGDSPS